MKTLVTYYSRTGTTKAVGEAIAKELGADSEEIIDLKKRTGLRPISYIIAGYGARFGRLTNIRFKRSPDDYDMIIIGTPVWALRMTPAARAYLASQKLEGKRVAFFVTYDGAGLKGTIEELKKLAPKSVIVGTIGILAKEVKSGAYWEKLRYFVEILRNQDLLSSVDDSKI